MNLNKLLNWTLDILFPKSCLGCGKNDFYLCEDCFESIKVLQSMNCFLCGKRSPTGCVCANCKKEFHPALRGLFVASDRNNKLLRQVIYEYKYRFVKELSAPLSRLMIDFLETNKLTNPRTLLKKGVGINCSTDKLILIPVPLHKRRLLWRGFNQAELLAQNISEHFEIKMRSDILKRVRNPLPQMEIKNRDDRKENIKNAFAVNKNFLESEVLKNKIVILVDDISTTASTLEECARALKQLKPEGIWGLVITRG